MDRNEHMDWCKERAYQYLETGDTTNAWSSMVSDLGKHEETAGHPAIEIGMMMLMTGQLSSVQDMRNFISGFN